MQELNLNNLTVERLRLKIKSIRTRYSTELVKIREVWMKWGGDRRHTVPKTILVRWSWQFFLRTNEWRCVTQFFTHQRLFLLILFFNNSCKFSDNTSEIVTAPTRITSVCAILKWTDSFNIVDTCKQKLNSTTQSIWLIKPSLSLRLNRVNAANKTNVMRKFSFNSLYDTVNATGDFKLRRCGHLCKSEPIRTSSALWRQA